MNLAMVQLVSAVLPMTRAVTTSLSQPLHRSRLSSFCRRFLAAEYNFRYSVIFNYVTFSLAMIFSILVSGFRDSHVSDILPLRRALNALLLVSENIIICITVSDQNICSHHTIQLAYWLDLDLSTYLRQIVPLRRSVHYQILANYQPSIGAFEALPSNLFYNIFLDLLICFLFTFFYFKTKTVE